VRLRLASPDEVAVAAAELRDRAVGLGLDPVRFLVQRMAPPGLELILGAKLDPSFGSVVLVGAGGILGETLADRVITLPAISVAEAGRMLAALRIDQLFAGIRRTGPFDRDAVCAAIASLSELVIDLGDTLEELDVNPLVAAADGRGAMAVDAFIRLRAAAD
jgi:acyl-CoA synthetase (NDP forming)